MPEKFLLPDPGEGIHEADIVEIHVSAGDQVKDGDPLFTVETDKAVVDIPSSFDGEIVEVSVETGDTVEVGVKDKELQFSPRVINPRKPARRSPTSTNTVPWSGSISGASVERLPGRWRSPGRRYRT